MASGGQVNTGSYRSLVLFSQPGVPRATAFFLRTQMSLGNRRMIRVTKLVCTSKFVSGVNMYQLERVARLEEVIRIHDDIATMFVIDEAAV